MTRTARGPIRSFHVERWFHVEHRRGMAACRSAVGQRPGPARRRTGSRSYLESRWRVRRRCRADTPYLLGVRVFSRSTPTVACLRSPGSHAVWGGVARSRCGRASCESSAVRCSGRSPTPRVRRRLRTVRWAGTAPMRGPAVRCGCVSEQASAGASAPLRPRVRADDRRRCRTRLPVSVDPGCGVPGWFCAAPACSSTAGLARGAGLFGAASTASGPGWRSGVR